MLTIVDQSLENPKPADVRAALAAFDRLHAESVAQNRLHLAEPIDVLRMLVDEHGAARIGSLLHLLAAQRGEAV